MKRKVVISSNTPNSKVQNILGILFILEAVVLLILSLLGYI